VRLGTWLPFEQVPEALAFLTGVRISVDTARTLTEQAGAALVQAEEAEVDRIDRDAPPIPAGPAVQQLSADGTMVPLVGGEWAEVRTLATGTVKQCQTKEGEQVPHCTELSYFSRLADAATFTRSAVLETHRRGTARAETVCAVVDGAEWLQRFIDLHRSDAVRILDFPHAAEYLAKAAHAAFGVGTEQATTWLEEQLRLLKEEDPDQVLATLHALPLEGGAAGVRDGVVHYLEERRSQIAYAHFRAQGYPIGSGIVESGNKLVIGARMKGSGMHWARGNVNPMVALRAVTCSGCWSSAWVSIWQQRRTEVAQQHHARVQRRQEERRDRERQQASPALADPAPAELAAGASPKKPVRPKQVIDGKPTTDHPWRSFRLTSRRSA
jgi:hypothetical protein